MRERGGAHPDVPAAPPLPSPQGTGELGYPGGPFDPLQLSKTPEFKKYKVNEIANGRYAHAELPSVDMAQQEPAPCTRGMLSSQMSEARAVCATLAPSDVLVARASSPAAPPCSPCSASSPSPRPTPPRLTTSLPTSLSECPRAHE